MGKQRNLAAPEALLRLGFHIGGNIPDDMAPVRGRTKSQKVGMNCSAMINADCWHTRARGVSSMSKLNARHAAGRGFGEPASATHHADGHAHQPHEKRHVRKHEELHVHGVLDVGPVRSLPSENE